MADLVTLPEVRTFFQHDPDDTERDDLYTLLIPSVTAAIRSLTERDFGSDQVSETREYDYDGSGYIDIDDASVITAVQWKVPYSDPINLEPTDWRAGPTRRDDAPVYLWIEVQGGWAGVSPEMGFNRNLDVLAREGRLGRGTGTALVTGTFGWPTVPADVKLAAYWTLQDWVTKPTSEGLTSEAIEAFSRSWNRGGSAPQLGIPTKARDLLAQYTRHQHV